MKPYANAIPYPARSEQLEGRASANDMTHENATKRDAMWTDNGHEADACDYLHQTGTDPAGDTEQTTATEDSRDAANDITQSYLDEIGRLPILTAEEEHDHAVRMTQGDASAREILITHNLRLVVYVAKRYLGRGLPLLDLVEEGNLGLMHALEKFDPHRGFRLSTYAHWWIRQSIERGLMLQSRTVRLPVHVAKELGSCLRARAQLENSGVVDPGPEEIARATGKPVEDVREVMLLNRPPLPLDAPLEADPDLTLSEAIADEQWTPQDEQIHHNELQEYVLGWLKNLPSEQRLVIERRFGLDNQEGASLAELARELQVSPEQVKKIQIDAEAALASELRAIDPQSRNWMTG